MNEGSEMSNWTRHVNTCSKKKTESSLVHETTSAPTRPLMASPISTGAVCLSLTASNTSADAGTVSRAWTQIAAASSRLIVPLKVSPCEQDGVIQNLANE